MPLFRTVRFACAVAISLSSTATSSLTYAQTNFPTKPVRLIIPFTAGSATDLLARRVALKMSEGIRTHAQDPKSQVASIQKRNILG